MIQGQPIDRAQVAQLIAENEALRKRVHELEADARDTTWQDHADYWQKRAERAEAELAAAREDAERLEWLTRNVSGAELRAIGVMWPAWSMQNARAAIDTARGKA